MTASRPTADRRRRGAILLVVLALLALFAVIGLSFVLYAESEATAARIYREAKNNRDGQRPNPEASAARAVTQLVWGTTDPTSAFNGHDLARLLYGVDGTVPYNGTGLFHEPLSIPTNSPTPLTINRADVIDHRPMLFDRPNPLNPAAPVTAAVVDPEYTQANGQVRSGNLLPANTFPADATLRASPWIYIAKNAPYTYPDRNNVMTAAADPLTGRVIVPSAHRPALFTGVASATDWFGTPQTNPNWYAPRGRLKLLRPRRVDNLTTAERTALRAAGLWPIPADIDTNPGLAAQRTQLANFLSDGSPNGVGKFPYPAPNPDNTRTGDVQNYKFGANSQRNDSVWLDAGLPVQNYKGRRLAPLVAFTLLPLDGRVNLNASGNVKGTGNVHASNQGYGPHEINLGAVLANAANAPTLVSTRYLPATAATAPGGGATTVTSKPAPVTPSYSQVDWGGTATAAAWLSLPGSTAAPNGLASSPTYTTNSAADATNHPALWNAFQRPQYQTSDANTPPAPSNVPHAYPLTDLKLFGGRYSGRQFDYQNQTFLANDVRNTGGTAQFQDEFLDNRPGAADNRARNLVTPFSVGFAKGSLAPNWFGTQTFSLAAGAASPSLAAAPQLDLTTVAGSSASLSDERQQSGQVKVQNLRAALGAVNLNRPLADYRTQAALTATPPQSLALAAANNNITVDSESAAWNDRQQMAADIFIRLCVATGAKIAFDTNIPADATSIPENPPGTKVAKLPYSDNVTRQFDPDGTGPTPAFLLRSGYVLPQPTGYNTTINETTYALLLNPVPQPNGSLAGGIQTTVTKAEYDALRYLAQLAANIVDQIDGDDVSTAFVWNPAPRTVTAGSPTAQPAVPPYPAASDSTTPVPPSLVPSTPTSRLVAADPATNPAGWSTPLNAFVPITRTAAPPDAFIFVEERAVFGVEKPRLVLNEAYAEVTNNGTDARQTVPALQQARRDFRVRFWLELLNPSAPEAAGSLLAGPDAASLGAVPLSQNNYSGTPASVYRVEIFDKGTPVLNQLAKPGNVTGAVNALDPVPANTIPAWGTPGGTLIDRSGGGDPFGPNDARLTCNLAGLTAASGTATQAQYVEANNGVGAAAAPNRNGFAVVGPDLDPADNYQSGEKAFVPTTTGGQPFNLMLKKAPQTNPAANQSQPDHLDYVVPRIKASDVQNNVLNPLNTADANQHVVLLQRLANPYLPFDAATNPYLTVDVVSQVPVNDAIRYGSDTAPDTHTPTTEAERFAVGRVQPFAGYQDFRTDAVNKYQYPTATAAAPTLTLDQKGTVPGATPPIQQKMSFFRHNSQADAPPTAANDPAAGGDATLLTPFHWLAHFDRPLVNQAELLHVPAVPPHLLTRRFVTPTAGSATLAVHTHDLQHKGATAGTGDGPLFSRDTTTQAVVSPLYRALDLLQTKPWTHGVPTDGRQAGRVNLNMLFCGDQTTPSPVFRAVLDGRAAGAGANGFTETEVDAMWAAVVKSRSPQWALGGAGVVGHTADELGANPDPAITQFDRPFKGLGTGLFTGSAGSGVGVTFPTAGTLATQFQAQPPGLEDTLLRGKTQPGVPDPTPYPSGLTGLFQNPAAPNATAGTNVHPYQQWEPLRKVMNSFSTTTDSYLLLVTVGFFEVLDDQSNPPEFDAAGRPARVLRAEAYDDAPGDLRAQFVAVIDRTGVTRPLAGVTDLTGLTADAQGRTPNRDGSYGLVTDPPEVRKPAPGSGPWVLEINRTIPATVADTPVATKLFLSVAQDTGGNPNRPQAVVNRFHTGRPDPDTTNFPGFFTILSEQDVPASPTRETITLPDPRDQTALPLHYDGRQFTLTATVRLTASGTARNAGTRFFVGANEEQDLVEAFFDPSVPGTEWSYNPTTGELKLPVRGIDPVTGTAGPIRFVHVAGGVATNAKFGHAGPSGARPLKVGEADPVVRMFTELK